LFVSRLRHENSREHKSALKEWNGESAQIGATQQECQGLNLCRAIAKETPFGQQKDMVRKWWLAGCPAVKCSVLEDLLVDAGLWFQSVFFGVGSLSIDKRTRTRFTEV
jgi:hypothetical protein